MIKHIEAFDKAVVASSRHQYVNAYIDIVDPDMEQTGYTTNSESKYSFKEQLAVRNFDEAPRPIASLEKGRFLLDGVALLPPDTKEEITGHYGWESESVCDDNGNFATPYPKITDRIKLGTVDVMQFYTICFSGLKYNGIGKNFTVRFYSGDTLVETKEITDNTQQKVIIEGINVIQPTRIELTVKKWSIGNRRARVTHMFSGLLSEWTTRDLKGVNILHESTFSCLSLPCSVCNIEVENADKKYDPYSPNSVFKSIEDRQAVVIKWGIDTDDGYEVIPAGTFFQQSGGWKFSDLTVEFTLVDIIGMLANRSFVVPSQIPNTLAGWVEAIMLSIGVNFRKMYVIDDDIKNAPLTAFVDDIKEKSCGEILRFACMAVNAWPRQDIATGKLRIGKLEKTQGADVTLDNMYEYPEISAAEDIANITFTIDSGEIVVPGTNTESEKSLSVKNPFVHVQKDVITAAKSALLEYGGKSIKIESRGNIASETGDIQQIETAFGFRVAGRMYKHQLDLTDGVMKSCPSELIQTPFEDDYKNRVILTGSGEWTAPDGVTAIKITLIGGGDGGTGGRGGMWVPNGPLDNDTSESTPPGERTTGGYGGEGGKVYLNTISINENQTFPYSCGAKGTGGKGGIANINTDDYYNEKLTEANSGAAGTKGGETTFGSYSTENGDKYSVGYIDLISGRIFAAKGYDDGKKIDGWYGCGGDGGKNGADGSVGPGYRYYPTNGQRGKDGQDGAVIIDYN